MADIRNSIWGIRNTDVPLVARVPRRWCAGCVPGYRAGCSNKRGRRAWRMPLNLKIRDGKGKWLLREVLYRHVPKELIERPKKGFSISRAAWLHGPLRDWAEGLLSEGRLKQEVYFHPLPVRQAWLEHVAGRRDNSTKLWSILMFQARLEKQGVATSGPGR